MTAQIMETLYIGRKKHLMASEPFGDYLETHGNPPEFGFFNTGCWRGYFGKWKLRDKKLYLTGLEAYIASGDEIQEVGLDYFFPDQKQVFAEWFSGEIRLPMGELLTYIHAGYCSVYEEDLIMDIEKGVVVKEYIISNGSKESCYLVKRED